VAGVVGAATRKLSSGGSSSGKEIVGGLGGLGGAMTGGPGAMCPDEGGIFNRAGLIVRGGGSGSLQ